MSKPIIALDIDGVVFNSTPSMMDKLNAKFRTSYTLSDVTDFSYSNFSERERLYIFKLWEETDYHTSRLPEGFDWAMKELRQIGRVIAVSTPMPRGPLHITSKWERLQSVFGRENVYLCKDKSLINADILIEDSIKNAQSWITETDRPVIVFERPYNKRFIHDLELQAPAPAMVGSVERFDEIPDAVEDLLDAQNV